MCVILIEMIYFIFFHCSIVLTKVEDKRKQYSRCSVSWMRRDKLARRSQKVGTY